eukprot:gene19581-26264_t
MEAQKKKRVKKVAIPSVVNEFRVDQPPVEDDAPKHEHVILHLKTASKSNDMVGEVLGYQEDSAFSAEPQSYSVPLSDCDAKGEIGTDARVVMPNMVANDTWPIHINSACFWCAHKFFNTPIGLPVKMKDNKFHTCGCFCSLECAASFNFNCCDLCQNKWFSYQLLNRLASKLGSKEIVKQAPSRFALKMFGGWMDIEEFRMSNKLIAVLPHPMVSVVQYMEEIMPCDAVKTSTSFVQLDHERVQKYTQLLEIQPLKKINRTDGYDYYLAGRLLGIGRQDPIVEMDVRGTLRCLELLMVSDKDQKSNIKLVEPNVCVTIVDNFSIYTFDFKVKPGSSKYGFIAQDVESVMPTAMVLGADGVKTVDVSQILAVVTGAVKSLSDRVTHLERVFSTLADRV